MPFKDSASKIPHWSATFKHSNNRLSYHIKQPVFFIVIEVVKTKAYFVNLANILTETNLLHNNHGKCVHLVVCSSHAKLFCKLESMGFTGNLLQWLVNFLTDRWQCTGVGNCMSDPARIISGVIQGSCIGLLLFCCTLIFLPVYLIMM